MQQTLDRIFSGHFTNNPRRGPSPRVQKLVLCAIVALRGRRIPIGEFADMCDVGDDNCYRALRILADAGWIRGGADNGFVRASVIEQGDAR